MMLIWCFLKIEGVVYVIDILNEGVFIDILKPQCTVFGGETNQQKRGSLHDDFIYAFCILHQVKV